MSDPTTTPTDPATGPTPAADRSVERTRPERVAPALGALVVAVAVTSLLDDAGILAIAWWLPFVLLLAAGAVLLAVNTIRHLLDPVPHPS